MRKKDLYFRKISGLLKGDRMRVGCGYLLNMR